MPKPVPRDARVPPQPCAQFVAQCSRVEVRQTPHPTWGMPRSTAVLVSGAVRASFTAAWISVRMTACPHASDPLRASQMDDHQLVLRKSPPSGSACLPPNGYHSVLAQSRDHCHSFPRPLHFGAHKTRNRADQTRRRWRSPRFRRRTGIRRMTGPSTGPSPQMLRTRRRSRRRRIRHSSRWDAQSPRGTPGSDYCRGCCRSSDAPRRTSAARLEPTWVTCATRQPAVRGRDSPLEPGHVVMPSQPRRLPDRPHLVLGDRTGDQVGPSLNMVGPMVDARTCESATVSAASVASRHATTFARISAGGVARPPSIGRAADDGVTATCSVESDEAAAGSSPRVAAMTATTAARVMSSHGAAEGIGVNDGVVQRGRQRGLLRTRHGGPWRADCKSDFREATLTVCPARGVEMLSAA